MEPPFTSFRAAIWAARFCRWIGEKVIESKQLPRHEACGNLVDMTQPRVQEGSLRPGSREVKRLAWALAISLLIHFLGYGGYEVGRRLNLHLPGWMEKLRQLAAVPLQPKKPPVEQEVPLMF